MAEDISFRLKVIDDKLAVALDQNTQRAKGLSDTLKIAAGTFAGNIAIKGFDLLGDAIKGATGFLFDAVAASSESETALNNLQSALERTGQATKENIDSFKALAERIQQTTAFEDDAVVSAGALIQTLGRLSGEGLNRATDAAVNLSAALGIDLESAATLVGKAANGNVTALQKLGIEVKKGITDSETFANTLKILEDRFSGSAAAQTKTFAGSLSQLKNVYDDVLEGIGGVITSNPAIIAGFNTLKVVVVDLGKRLTELFQDQSSIKGYVDGILTASQFIIDGFDGIFRVASAVFNGITLVINGFLATYLGAVSTIINAATNIPVVGEKFKGAAEVAQNAFESFRESAEQDIQDVNNALTSGNAFTAISDGIGNAKSKYNEFFEQVKAKAPELKNNLTPGSDTSTQQDAESIKRTQALKSSLLELEQQFAVEKLALDEANRQADDQRFFTRSEEDIVRLQQFEQQKLDIKLDAALRAADAIAVPQEKELARQKAFQQREIDGLKVTQQTKAQIRQQDIANQAAFFGAATSLASSKNKELAAIGKAAGLAEIAIKTPQAFASSYAFGTKIGGPVTGAIFGGIAAAAMAAQASQLAGVKGFESGGIIAGNSMTGDNLLAKVNSKEMVLNQDQQANLFEMIKNGSSGSQPIVVQIDGVEVFRAVRNQLNSGMKFA
jgi:hypothetical protein